MLTPCVWAMGYSRRRCGASLCVVGALVMPACGGISSTGSSPAGGSSGAPPRGASFGSGGGPGASGVTGAGGSTPAAGGNAPLAPGAAGSTVNDAGGNIAVGGAGGTVAAQSGGAGTATEPGAGGVAGSTGTGGGSAFDAGPPSTGGHEVDGGPFTGPCNFVVQVTTVSANGRYAPHNTAAIWIETGAGDFVKTLRTWGSFELLQLVDWTRASMGANVDAITAATRRDHGRVRATWNCTDNDRAPVPDGPYQVCAAFTEQTAGAGPGRLVCVPFDKTSAVLDVWPAPTPNFVDMHLFLQPL